MPMILELVTIDCNNINDWESFHDEFTEKFGFPGFYGRNMNAWHDCLSDLHDPDAGMSKIHCERGIPLVVVLKSASELKSQCPEQYQAILEGCAFVNWRNMDVGEPPVITLSFSN